MSIAESVQQSDDVAPSPLSPPQVLAAFSGLMVGMLLGALDQTILATALPTIVGELGGLSLLSWVVIAYLLDVYGVHPVVGQARRSLRS